MLHALVVEDDLNSIAALTSFLEGEGFTASSAGTLKEAREKCGAERPDLILTDLILPDGMSLDLIRDLGKSPGSEVVIVTGQASIETAIEALRLGVVDYLTKPIDLPRLKTVLWQIARARELKEELGSLREELRRLGHFGLLGASASMEKVYDLLCRVGPTEVTVLLTGESGTGKDIAARTLHELSRRRKGPYLPLNCGAVSPNLIESELFGHEKGSFTGASRTHHGYFERASGGTLFLDEISEMPLELQVKLLRVLETGTVLRIGADSSLQVDVRVIAATNRKLEDAVGGGKFREDLLYRLNGFPIHLPPLREREGDIDLLAEQFLGQLNLREGTHKKLTKDALDRLREHSWPGNVRELKNVVHRAFILADVEIGAECIAIGMGGPGGRAPLLSLRVGMPLSDVEKRVILATLDLCGGDKKKTADVLGLSLRTLYYRLHTYNME